jgi:hypothetical protein
MLLGLLSASLSFAQAPTPQGRRAEEQTKIFPECPPTESIYWNNCTGTYTSPSGKKYYVGEFRNGQITGQGTLTYAGGANYVGEFRDGQLAGQGTLTFTNGDKYVGEFRDGKFTGQGTNTFSSGAKYIGEFRDGKRTGKGTYMFSNGDKYIGEFFDGKRTGQGAYTFSNGKQYVGEFKDGKFLEPAPRLEIVLHNQNGVLLVPVLINNKIPLDFVLDSGATDVSVPADVVLTLMRTGTLTEADFTGTTTYVLADGSEVPSQTFRIRSLKVGAKILEDVSGSVASVKGTLLLGQSFLSRFKSWSIDNERQVLVLQ